MRQLTDHVVIGDSADHQLLIEVMDEPGAGGANHMYGITNLDIGKNPSYEHCDEEKAANYDGPEDCTWIIFQNGPIKESGVNGVTQEALLTIVIDRLRSFQSGPFSCRENAIALTHCEDALMWLQRRTIGRIKRGVEGTNKK